MLFILLKIKKTLFSRLGTGGLFMLMPKLRDIEDRPEILKIVSHLKQSGISLVFWQNLNDHRQSCRAVVSKIDLGDQKIEFSPISQNFNFKPLDSLYIFCRKKFILIKAQIIFNSKFKIVIDFPAFLKSEECRELKRQNLLLEKKLQYIQFNKMTKNEIGLRYFKSKLLDISEHGLAFQISAYDALKLVKGDKLALQVVSGQHQHHFVPGVIHYIKRYVVPEKAGDFYRVGVLFNQKTKPSAFYAL